MSLIGRLFKRSLPPKLGRWRTDEPVEIILRKVELATDDHCGSDLCSKKIYPEHLNTSPKKQENKLINDKRQVS
tara:strand:- start:35 stop:256 length:222 start_codon:yes stop_codon:yes gene_type:complete